MKLNTREIVYQLTRAAEFCESLDSKNLRGKAHYQAGYLDGLMCAVVALGVSAPDRMRELRLQVEARRSRR